MANMYPSELSMGEKLSGSTLVKNATQLALSYTIPQDGAGAYLLCSTVLGQSSSTLPNVSHRKNGSNYGIQISVLNTMYSTKSMTKASLMYCDASDTITTVGSGVSSQQHNLYKLE